jgi:SAM-dependent methyltransferase
MRELGADFYDSMHAKIDRSVTRTRYDGLFRKIVANVRNHGSHSIREVGCGSGFLAKMILQKYTENYRCLDFSAEAIRNASHRTGRPNLFFVGDARDGRSYMRDYDTIVVRRRWNTSIAILRLFAFGASGHGASAQFLILTTKDMSVSSTLPARS